MTESEQKSSHQYADSEEKIEPTNYWNYINLSTISKGLYTIAVSSEDHQIIRKKLVKL